MNNTRLKELIAKYLEGRATGEERQEVEAWYQSFESGQGLMEQLDREQQEAFGKLLYERIDRDIDAQSEVRRKHVFIRNMRWIAAAGAALLLGLAGTWLTTRNAGKDAELVTVTARAEKGAIRKVTLPDGSTLWLNAASSMRFTQNKRNTGSREAWLEGEGYFDVAQQPGRPFIVHAGNLDVRVLGTSFNVDAYNPARTVAVTVASGKVAVESAHNRSNVLSGNEQIIYHAATGQLTRNGIAAKDIIAWTSGQLVFKKQLFRDIAERLERRYNARIRFENATIANCLLTASFDENVPLEDVLAMLCRIYGYSYRQEGDAGTYLILDSNH